MDRKRRKRLAILATTLEATRRELQEVLDEERAAWENKKIKDRWKKAQTRALIDTAFASAIYHTSSAIDDIYEITEA